MKCIFFIFLISFRLFLFEERRYVHNLDLSQRTWQVANRNLLIKLEITSQENLNKSILPPRPPRLWAPRRLLWNLGWSDWLEGQSREFHCRTLADGLLRRRKTLCRPRPWPSPHCCQTPYLNVVFKWRCKHRGQNFPMGLSKILVPQNPKTTKTTCA